MLRSIIPSLPITKALLLTALTAVLLLPQQISAAVSFPGTPSKELIIKYSEAVSDLDLERTFKKGRLKFRKYVHTRSMRSRGKIGLVCASTTLGLEQAIQALRQDPAVEYVEPNFTVTTQAVSNDPFFTNGDLWAVDDNIFGSRASSAWAAGLTGSSSVHVAIIDDGAQITHEDLAFNMWTNPYEIDGDDIDNDGNGFTNDVKGWNFTGEIADESNEPYNMADAHGTLVAGLIGAVGGNGIGSVGVNWNVTMIPLRSLSGGSGSVLDIIEAIDYCTDLKTLHPEMHLVAINASFGFAGYSLFLHEAVIRAANKDILFIAAAGNSGADNDAQEFSPANIDTTVGTFDADFGTGELPASYNSVISVAAIDSDGNLATFSTGGSSFGLTTVHLGAPGQAVISPHPENLYYTSSGTSMAAPMVAGSAALYASAFPGSSAAEIRAALLSAVEPTPSLVGKTATGGRLSLSFLAPAPPSPPSPAVIVGRYLLYNQSVWDGNNAVANSSDDAAIPPDKTALLPGNVATLANYSSYFRGINGIILDIENLGNAGALSAADFTFKVGNDNLPSAWAVAPEPQSVSVRAGAGANGSDRVTIIWVNNAIQKQWLQVTVSATENTGLTTADVFYFGNAIGEAGNSINDARVSSADSVLVRNNLKGSGALITNNYDHNRDGRVTSSDSLIARNNLTSISALRLVAPPAP